MPVESATYISDLNASNPVGATDPKSQGDDHLRLIKATVKSTFSQVAGEVAASHIELNYLDGATGVSGTGNTIRSASPTFTGTITFASATGSGTVTANLFSGSGASLTNLNASNLASGTVPDARFPATLPAVSGANLTNLDATDLASGTVADARLSGNVALRNVDNAFTGSQTFGGSSSAPVRMKALDTIGDCYIQAYSSDGSTSRFFIGNAGSGTNDCFYINEQNAALIFGTNATERMRINADGTLTTPNLSAAEPGYKGLPQNPQAGNYTAVLADANTSIRMAGSAATFTIPANASVAYPVGTVLTVVNISGGNITIAITTDTLVLAATTTTGSRTLAGNGFATAYKYTSNGWIISGAGLS